MKGRADREEQRARTDRIGEIELRLQEIAAAKLSISREMSELVSETARLKKEKAELDAARIAACNGVAISDHALIRWMERHHGIDLEMYRQEMAGHIDQRAVAVGANGYKTSVGTFKITDSVVTTFFTGRELKS